MSPKPRPPAATATTAQQRSPSQKQRPPLQAKDAQNHSQVVVLASIDLRSQHGRLVSARFNASVRKGVQGSCKRAASQAAGRAHRIVLQRSRPRRGEKEGSKGLPGQNLSKCLLSLLPRHGVHREQGLPTVTRRSPSGSDGFQGPPLAIGSAQAGMRNDGNGRSGAREFPRAHS